MSISAIAIFFVNPFLFLIRITRVIRHKHIVNCRGLYGLHGIDYKGLTEINFEGKTFRVSDSYLRLMNTSLNIKSEKRHVIVAGNLYSGKALAKQNLPLSE